MKFDPKIRLLLCKSMLPINGPRHQSIAFARNDNFHIEHVLMGLIVSKVSTESEISRKAFRTST